MEKKTQPSTPPTLVILVAVSFVVLVAIEFTVFVVPAESSTDKPSRPPTKGHVENSEGIDQNNPSLAPEDLHYSTSGPNDWGWSDRCWKHLQKGKYGWAKAACQKGLDSSPASPSPKSSLLYNLGLIAKSTGDYQSARDFFTRSLQLREHPDVRRDLRALPQQ